MLMFLFLQCYIIQYAMLIFLLKQHYIIQCIKGWFPWFYETPHNIMNSVDFPNRAIQHNTIMLMVLFTQHHIMQFIILITCFVLFIEKLCIHLESCPLNMAVVCLRVCFCKHKKSIYWQFYVSTGGVCGKSKYWVSQKKCTQAYWVAFKNSMT